MSKIIAVNAGSSSLKFQLYEMPKETVLTSGIVERIGFEDAVFTIKVDGEKVSKTLPVKDHTVAVNLLLEALVEHNIVADLNEIVAAGHRVVHGGEYFSKSVLVDDDVVKKVDELCELAPLHNPGALVGYRAFKASLPNSKHVFTFDTAFHQTMEADTYIYPLPYEWYTEHKVRRYGMHGTSHQYVSQRCAELLNKDLKDTKIITLHLGGGASITAVDGGKSINTSMGFTPLGGIMMGTRCGDIDPAIVPFMEEQLGVSPKEMDTILNKQSGLLGVSGVSSDGRDIEKASDEGNERAKLAMSIFVNRVVQTVGSYYVQMGGLDAIVFTAGIGENDFKTRERVMRKLEATLGTEVDTDANKVRGEEQLLTTADSKVSVYLIPTNEEVMIARDTFAIVG
ncbi:acetate/propionate family kinase [Breznakia pachnodae]|uniref:Acetate kinase n=1 Tax=Breznakia pachnodae TaxID=265178 RepID=A0ABU0E7P4_9FIRM|nr:acetate kinase [Breznakia pachnodae]MDQ0362919.1 acetate kinase [Breznakia pachnodae]